MLDLLLTFNVSVNTPVKSLDEILYVPASLASSCPVDTSSPELVILSLEERGGLLVKPEGAVGNMREVVEAISWSRVTVRAPLTVTNE